ncbi:hypothetical protein OJAV_G00211110 [Oryzias javanicus]|uniref:Uncharacterized protein n=1 Tax=Oryzias javanicus TaxID=123683 RepID=A0A3S2LZB3_ORYJA|nr:hypothetical protein OJAV_G00211110 [Oryzias javanicus]
MKTRTAKVSADQGTTSQYVVKAHRQGSASRSPDRVSGVNRPPAQRRQQPPSPGRLLTIEPPLKHLKHQADLRVNPASTVRGVQPEEAVPPEVFVEICSSLESTRTPPNQAKHPTPEERLSESLNDRWKSPLQQESREPSCGTQAEENTDEDGRPAVQPGQAGDGQAALDGADAQWVENVVLSGGSTMFRDFGRRLRRDLKRAVGARLKICKELSGGKLKPKPIDVQVITHHMQRYAVWFGGSMLASTVSV